MARRAAPRAYGHDGGATGRRRRAGRAPQPLRAAARPPDTNAGSRGCATGGLARHSTRTQRTAMNPSHTDLPPLVAILRGLQPERAADVGRVLFDCGLRGLEVPLNRPGALLAIATLSAMAPQGALVGAGTVLTIAQVDA